MSPSLRFASLSIIQFSNEINDLENQRNSSLTSYEMPSRTQTYGMCSLIIVTNIESPRTVKEENEVKAGKASQSSDSSAGEGKQQT